MFVGSVNICWVSNISNVLNFKLQIVIIRVRLAIKMTSRAKKSEKTVNFKDKEKRLTLRIKIIASFSVNHLLDTKLDSVVGPCSWPMWDKLKKSRGWDEASNSNRRYVTDGRMALYLSLALHTYIQNDSLMLFGSMYHVSESERLSAGVGGVSILTKSRSNAHAVYAVSVYSPTIQRSLPTHASLPFFPSYLNYFTLKILLGWRQNYRLSSYIIDL